MGGEETEKTITITFDPNKKSGICESDPALFVCPPYATHLKAEVYYYILGFVLIPSDLWFRATPPSD